jgi:hypothetical protein
MVLNPTAVMKPRSARMLPEADHSAGLTVVRGCTATDVPPDPRPGSSQIRLPE